MNEIHHKISRMYFPWSSWLARHCPWYIKLVAGKHADEIFRRIKETEEKFRKG